MINLLSSGAKQPNAELVKVKRKPRQNNLQWLSQNINSGEHAALVMVGGISPTSFRIRVAQAHTRTDLMPSYWSHVMLLDRRESEFGETLIYEISLEPPAGFGFPPKQNGVQTGLLSQYASTKDFPNIAVLQTPTDTFEVIEALTNFQKQRAVLDTVDLMLHWLAYLWGVARSPNPLLDGLGTPSAAMLEIVVGACGFDLTPGLESRSSCPEAIWQAAKWWHDYYRKQNKPPLTGAYWCPHEIE